MARFSQWLKFASQHAGLVRYVLNVRAALMAGVGGFAVYQGAQQMGNQEKPTPKKIVVGQKRAEGANKLAFGQAGEAPPADGASEGNGGAYGNTAENAAPITDPPAGRLRPAKVNLASNEAPASEPPAAASDAPSAYGGAYDPTQPPATEAENTEKPAANALRGMAQNGEPADGGAAPPADANLVAESSPGTEPPAAPDASEPGVAQALPPERPITHPVVPRGKPTFAGARATPPGDPVAGSEAETTAEPQPITIPADTRPAREISPRGNSSKVPARVAAASLPARGETTGVPGERQLEGTQMPSISLEKFAPTEIQVGKPATFEVRVRNVGQVAAQRVVVTDHVPKGTQLEATQPEAQRGADGALSWALGTMQPGDEVVITMQLVPQTEGEIGSVAQVGFAAQATARSISTRPLLKIEHSAPKQILIGETLAMAITVTNPGTGAATNVVVEEDVPEGFSHVAGSQLEYEIGNLRPGESKRLELTAKAEKAGVFENVIVARGDANLASEHTVRIEVIAPQLQLSINGPKKRYLDRQATYSLTVANPGTAPARDVELVAYLPKGMRFVSADSEGQYDQAKHAVFWSLEELPAQKSGVVKLTATPVEAGQQRLRAEGRGGLGLTAAGEQTIQVEAASELHFTIADSNDPIEVGSDTTYEVRVSNNGSRPATQVRVAAAAPEGLKFLSAEGPSRAQTNAQQAVFEPIARINPGEEVTLRIHAQGGREGDHKIQVQISSEEFRTPVMKEESTQVYVDK